MIQRTFLSSIVLDLLLGPQVSAQEQGPPITWGAVQVGTGGFVDQPLHLFTGDLYRLAPGSKLLPQDLSDHRTNGPWTEGAELYYMGLGLHPFAREGSDGPELRFGLLATTDLSLALRFERTQRTPYDTLTSSQTGTQYFLDSVATSQYWIEHSYRLIGVSGALVWRTNGKLAFFGGVGVGVGLLYDARTRVMHQAWGAVEGTGSVADLPDPQNERKEEEFRNGTGGWFALHVPLGVDYRLHRSHQLWSRTRLFLELTPQMLFAQRPVLGQTFGLGSRILFGLRYQL